MDIQDELLKRYKYLYDNKELILANCIIYDIDKKSIKKELKKLKLLIKETDDSNKNDELVELAQRIIYKYENDLKIGKAYLSSRIPKGYTNMLEDFILGDKNIEETRLYKFIECIKDNRNLLMKYNSMINDLEERRNNNYHLMNVPTFTVWKILSFVRKKNNRNSTALRALDRYYNLDRFIIAHDDSKYGYYIPEDDVSICNNYPDLSLYNKVSGDTIIFNYRGNKFEEEDEYYASTLDVIPTYSFYPSKFANELSKIPMIENKEERLKDLIKTRTLTTIY